MVSNTRQIETYAPYQAVITWLPCLAFIVIFGLVLANPPGCPSDCITCTLVAELRG